MAIVLIALGGSACSSGGKQKAKPQSSETQAASAGPHRTTFQDISGIVDADGDWAGLHYEAKRTSSCTLDATSRNGKVVFVRNRPGQCSIQVRMKDEPVFGHEDEYIYPMRGIFKDLFATARVSSRLLPVDEVFIAADGPVTTVGGKTKEALVINADCKKAAADQIDWGNVDVNGIEQLCVVHKFVKFG